MFDLINLIDIRQQIVWVVFLSTLWIFPGCKQNQSSEPSQLSVHFEEKLVIGNDLNASEEYRFSRLSDVRSDQDGNIYIPVNNSVRVFSASGDFLYTIGRQGQGPGEFGNILAIDINSQNELITYDGRNRRFLRFSVKGEVLSTHILETKTVVTPAYFRQIDDDHYLFLRKLREIEESKNEEEQHLYSAVLHAFDSNFENHLGSFGHIDSLMVANTQFVQHYVSVLNTGHFWPAKSGDVWFVPGIYDGRLFRFQKRSDGWKLAETLHGNVLPEEPVDVDSNADGTIAITVYAPKYDTYSGKINSESLGIFTLNDERLVHFSSQLKDDERMTILEVFNPDGDLEGVGRLNEFTFGGSEKGALIGSIWKDKNDQFYIIDNRNNPVVRIGKIMGI